jgi:hypothetical protein
MYFRNRIIQNVVFVFALYVISIPGVMYGQGQTDPLTDPTAQTQTKAAPKTATPVRPKPVTKPVDPLASPNQPAVQKLAQPRTQQSAKKVEFPKPEDMILDTSDGVRLRVTYLAPPEKQKPKQAKVGSPTEAAPTGPDKAVPFILLHDWEGSRNDLAQYAIFLQRQGHAVIVPDLRGHGGSTEVVGVNKPIDATKFRKNEVMMAQKDIERCKKFLVQQHNKGEVNIDLLCVVAVGKTSVLAVQWTLNDWVAFPAYNSDGIKQGQDVKALMLVSPLKKLAGVSLLPTLKHGLFSGGRATMPVMVVWGASEETAKESEAIYNSLKKSRPDPSDIADPAERMANTTLFSVPIRKSQFSGKQMIEKQRVNGFFAYVTNLMFGNKVIARAEKFPWTTREVKEEDDE